MADYPTHWVERPKLDIDEEALRNADEVTFKAYEQMLAAYEESVARNPLSEVYVNSEHHHEFMAAREFIAAAFGGNQSGKTVAVVMLVVINCLPIEWVPPHLRQYRTYDHDRPFAARMCVPTLDKHAVQIALPYFKWLVPPSTLEGGSWEKGWNLKSYQISFKNGSTVQFRSYEQPTDAHAGPALDAIFFDEEPPRALYEENLRRLTTKENGFVRFAVTPIGGLTWLYHDIYQKRIDNPRIKVVGMSSYDNPFASHATIENILATSTSKAEVQSRLYGTFMAMEGRIYETFQNSPYDEETGEGHVIPPFTPANLRDFPNDAFIIGIDPEVRIPSAVFLRVDKLRQQAVQFDEYLPKMPGMNVKIFCEGLIAKCQEWGLRDPIFIIDPSAKASSVTSGGTILSEFTRYGIFAIPGNNDKQIGFARFNSLISNGQFFITSNCVKTRDEFDIYAWDSNAAEKGDSKAMKTKYAPNALDSARYAVMALPWEPDPIAIEPPPPVGSTLEWIGSGPKKPGYLYA